jgi:hypothetical protein
LDLFEEVHVSDNDKTESAPVEVTIQQIIERCEPMATSTAY